MASKGIDFSCLEEEDLKVLAKTNGITWAGQSRQQIEGALRSMATSEVVAATSLGGELSKECTDKGPHLLSVIADLAKTVSDLTSEIAELRKDSNSRQEAAIAAIREELLELKTGIQSSTANSNKLASVAPPTLTLDTSICEPGSDQQPKVPFNVVAAAPPRPQLHRTTSLSATGTPTLEPRGPTDRPNPSRRVETSRYVRAPKRKSSEERAAPRDFAEALRPKLKVYYVGAIFPNCAADSIAAHCRERNVDIVQCIVYSSEYFRTAHARVTVVESDAEAVEKPDFWPEKHAHTVRPWRFNNDGK